MYCCPIDSIQSVDLGIPHSEVGVGLEVFVQNDNVTYMYMYKQFSQEAVTW